MQLRKHFTEKIAIVTGGGSGIGARLCARMAQWGAVVVVGDVAEANAQQVAGAIDSAGGQAYARQVDVTHAVAVEALVNETVMRHGRLDYMFNNAGVAVMGEVRDLALDDWDRVVDVNLKGVIHGIHAAYPVMVRQQSGHIVNSASGYGLIPGPTLAPYVATKHAVVGLSETLRVEAKDLGVRVSVACPGFVRTPILNSPNRTGSAGDVSGLLGKVVIEADDAAAAILSGVVRNQGLIVFPTYVSLLSRLHRLAPGLMQHAYLRIMRNMRTGGR
ncbi:MAG: SDR family oxidoreductase [Anaerolineales bacterium]|nr:SDR family oxidoreductase [Anaerolineales bacterium]